MWTSALAFALLTAPLAEPAEGAPPPPEVEPKAPPADSVPPPPEVEPTSGDLEGAEERPLLPAEKVKAIVAAKKPAIGVCFEASAAKADGRGGLLELRWRVEADGSVSRTQIARDDLEDEALASCVIEVVKTMRFPRPETGGLVHVSYPFAFDMEPPPDEDEGGFFGWLAGLFSCG
jgi:hypothetical protein